MQCICVELNGGVSSVCVCVCVGVCVCVVHEMCIHAVFWTRVTAHELVCVCVLVSMSFCVVSMKRDDSAYSL